MKEISQKILYLILAVIIYILARILVFTCRTEIIRPREVEDYEASNRPVIYAFWHGRLLPTLFFRPKHKKVYAIVSRHGDGEFISDVLRLAGVGTIRGSTDRKKGETKISLNKVKVTSAKNRGGSFVIRESIRRIKSGDSIAVTPDGPRGPRFLYKTNSIRIASQTETPIIPATFSASRAYVFSSWDRFILPMPFSKIKIRCGDLVFIPRLDSDEETKKYGKKIENTLNDLTAELDKEFNINLN